MATFTKKAHLAQRDQFVSLCPTTVYIAEVTSGGTGLSLDSTTNQAYTDAAPYGSILPGFIKSTLAMTGSLAAGDVFRVPVRKDDSKLILYVALDTVWPKSTATYPMLAMRIPNAGYSTIQGNSPNWMSGSMVGSSTGNSDWKLIKSTSSLLATTTGELEAFIAGPFESAKYAMNFGNTSSDNIDKNQNYFEFAIMRSSVDTTGTWLSATTNVMSTDGCVLVLPIEVP